MSCHSSQPICRVDMPRISTMSDIGEECVQVPGMVGSLQSQVFTTPYNVTYRRPGVVIREFNPRSLRLPQKRPFLGPEIFNSGCATLYSNDHFHPERPLSHRNVSSATQHMYDTLWNDPGLFQGNNPPTNCACSKCDGPTSVLGWRMDSDGELVWKKKMGS